MIDFDVDVNERTVSFSVPKSLYSMEALRIAAHVFDGRAEVGADETKTEYELSLTSRRKAATKDELEALGGEFLNELLNQEYRFLVGKFNAKLANLVVTQTLFAARGGENPPAPPAEEQTPEFQAQVAELMKKAADEIARTMPKRIAPQGNPLPPAPEEANV